MLDLVRDPHLISILDQNHGAEINEFDTLKLLIVRIYLQEYVFWPQIAINSSQFGHNVQELADLGNYECQLEFSFSF